MTFFACGINHKTAPLSVREKLSASTPEQHARFLQGLIDQDEVREAVLLSTCNRTEFYCVAEQPQAVVNWLIHQRFKQTDSIESSFYQHTHHEGIRHAMRVACGLDSMMLGEPQVLGQMKQAYRIAEEVGSIGTTLRPIFHHIFSASKRIRSQTGIGVNPTSVAYTAVNLIHQKLGASLSHCHTFVIGAGETSQLVAKYLHQSGVEHFTIASRTLDHATDLAEQVNGSALSISDIGAHLGHTDVIICATACPMPFISHRLVTEAMTKRGGRPMFLLDLSVPRDIEAEVGQIDNVHLYNIDDLQHLAENGLSARKDAIVQAEQIIDCEIAEYIDWYRAQQAKDTIIQYRQEMTTRAELELTRVKKRLASGQIDANQALEELKHRLLQKLCHQPTVGMRRLAIENRADLLALTDLLFNKPNR